MRNFFQIFFITFALSLNLSYGRVLTVCELVEELDNLHEVPRDEIYKHLCIIGPMIHTNKSQSSFLGIYRIGEQWWCGQEGPGGSCNVKCSELYDDDIADDVRCASKILESHGLAGWNHNEQACRKYDVRVRECLETFDEFEDVEMLEVTKAPLLTSTKAQEIKISSTESAKLFDEIILAKRVETSFWSAGNFFIALALFSVAITSLIIYMRYQRIERFFRTTFTDAVQLV